MRKVRYDERSKEVDMIKGKFLMGWAEFKPALKEPIYDRKGRLKRYENLPPKIVTKLMVELDDGSCVSVTGDHFEPMGARIRGAFKAAFPVKFKATEKIAKEAYKNGEYVRIKRTTFIEDENELVLYDEVE